MMRHLDKMEADLTGTALALAQQAPMIANQVAYNPTATHQVLKQVAEILQDAADCAREAEDRYLRRTFAPRMPW